MRYFVKPTRLLLLSFTIVVTACSKVVVEPVGEPFIIELRINQTSGASQSVDLNALVAYGGFGGVASTVTFFSSGDVLATTSDSVPYTDNNPKIGEVFDRNYRKTITLQPNTDYNLSAKVTWTSKGVEKSLTSAVVKYRLPNPQLN